MVTLARWLLRSSLLWDPAGIKYAGRLGETRS